MRVLILDGHPDGGRLSSALLDAYAAALPAGTPTERIALRDLGFDPVLHRGLAAPQPWEDDLARAWTAILRADHLVIGHPLWWGAEPALLKGFWDRILLPDHAYRLRPGGTGEGLLQGRSADVLVTTGARPLLIRTLLADAPGVRIRQMILGYCGITSVRMRYFGPTDEDVARRIDGWRGRAGRLGRTAAGRWRGEKR